MSRSLAERPKGLTLTNKRGVGYAAAQIDRRKGGFEISQKSVQLNGGDTHFATLARRLPFDSIETVIDPAIALF